MPLNKMCPICQRQVLPTQLRAYSSVVGLPKATDCPHCGTRLTWSKSYWYLAHFGGLVTFLGALGLLASLVKLIGPEHFFDLFSTTMAGLFIMFIGVWRSKLVEVK